MKLKSIIAIFLTILGTLFFFSSCTKTSELEESISSRGGGACLPIQSFSAKVGYIKGRLFPQIDASITVKPCTPDQTIYVVLEVINAVTGEVTQTYPGIFPIQNLSTRIVYSDYPPAYTLFTARLSVYSDSSLSILLDTREVTMNCPPKVKA